MTKNRRFMILRLNEKERNFLDKNKLIFQGIFYAIFHTLKIFCHADADYVAKKIHFWVKLNFNFSSKFIFSKTSILEVDKFFTVYTWKRYIQKVTKTLLRAMFLTQKCHFCGTWRICEKTFGCGTEFEAFLGNFWWSFLSNNFSVLFSISILLFIYGIKSWKN